MNMNLANVAVTRTIPAPAEKVFDVWLDSKSPGGPWHGAERVILNPVVDGLFYLAVKHEDRVWPHYGRFLRIDRPRCVEFTWVSEGTRGVESVVRLTLEPQGDHTEVTLHHSGMPDDEMALGHKEGWTWALSMLSESLTLSAPAAPGS
jgi:uncharacterized protein YndB with AHSA1/START domain